METPTQCMPEGSTCKAALKRTCSYADDRSDDTDVTIDGGFQTMIKKKTEKTTETQKT